MENPAERSLEIGQIAFLSACKRQFTTLILKRSTSPSPVIFAVRMTSRNSCNFILGIRTCYERRPILECSRHVTPPKPSIWFGAFGCQGVGIASRSCKRKRSCVRDLFTVEDGLSFLAGGGKALSEVLAPDQNGLSQGIGSHGVIERRVQCAV